MKQNDVVTITKTNQEQEKNNLYVGAMGIVLKVIPISKALVLFFNDKIEGDYMTAIVDKKYLKKQDVELPAGIFEEINKKMSNLGNMEKQKFNKLKFKEYDFVELVVEDEKYAKEGIHKGERGVVAIDYAISNKILVDFSGIDENGEYYGDIIMVNLEHIQHV